MSRPSNYGQLRFCPKCGCDKLIRDWFPADSKEDIHNKGAKHPKMGCEYVCESCGFGFVISKSRRVLFADSNFARERQRAPVKFTEACIGKEVTDLYLNRDKIMRVRERSGIPMLVMVKEKVLRTLGLSNKCSQCPHTKHKGKCKDNNGKCACYAA